MADPCEGAGVKKRLAGRTQRHDAVCARRQSDIPNSLVVHLPCTLTGRAALQRRQQSNITIADRGRADVAGAWNVSAWLTNIGPLARWWAPRAKIAHRGLAQLKILKTCPGTF